MMILPRSFYEQNTLKVAQDLLGCFLVRKYKGKIIKSMICETEAYRSENDLACHAARGRTRRTEVMYGPAGHAYVYFVYGMHWMLNIVTEKENFPAAVLVRSIDTSIDASKTASKKGSEYINGPGKLTKYLRIDGKLNGWDMTRGEKLWVEKPPRKQNVKIIESPRVGISYAKHCQNWKWNFRLYE